MGFENPLPKYFSSASDLFRVLKQRLGAAEAAGVAPHPERAEAQSGRDGISFLFLPENFPSETSEKTNTVLGEEPEVVPEPVAQGSLGPP